MSIIIGIDHGYYAIKTAHCSFPAGLTSYGEHEPYTRQGLLEFGGCFFVCGSGRQPIQRDKTVNDNYYLLTLAAIAKEIRQRGLPPECSVRIAAGLPLTGFGRDKPKFREYLLRSNQPVNYKFEGVEYSITIEEVAVFPQGYMAQLKAMYKDDWESLVGLCDEFLYLGGTEKETHKYVSELLGKETISTTSYNQSKGRSGSYSINHQQSGRDLMTPDEVRLLDNSKCILFIRGERPVVDLKYNLLKHPNIRYTEDGGAAPYDYTAADNALDDLPGAPGNYELLDMDDFLPAEAAEMKPTIRKADNIAVFGFMKADKAHITATAVTAGKAVTAVLEISCVPFRFCGQVLFICGVSFCASRKRQPAPHRRQSATQPTIQGALLRGQLARGSGCCPVLR